jgi:hypothetical protein
VVRTGAYRPRFTKRRRAAALAAIGFCLDPTRTWPSDVTNEDLEGAREAIKALADRWTTGRES